MDSSIQSALRAAVDAIRDQRMPEAFAILSMVIARAVDAGAADMEMFARGLRAPTSATLGDLSGAQKDSARALELAEELGDEESIAQYRLLVHQLAGERWDAPSVAEEPAGMSTGNPEWDELLNQAAAAMTVGDSAGAREALEPLLAQTIEAGDAAFEGSVRGMLAQALMAEGHLEDARPHLLRALEIARDEGDPVAEQHFADLLGALHHPADAARAVEAARQAVQLHAAIRGGIRALEAGDADGALQVLYPGLQGAKDAASPSIEATMRGLVSQSLTQLGRRDEAIAQAQRAIALAEAAGDVDAVEGFNQVLQLALGLVPPIAQA